MLTINYLFNGQPTQLKLEADCPITAVVLNDIKTRDIYTFIKQEISK